MIKQVSKAVISLVTMLAILGSIFTLVVLAALITLFCEIPFMITFLGLSTIIVLTIKLVINSSVGEINIDFSDDEDLKDHIG